MTSCPSYLILNGSVLQFLDHNLPGLAVEAAEALVDDDRLNGAVLPAGVRADAQSQAHSHAKFLLSDTRQNRGKARFCEAIATDTIYRTMDQLRGTTSTVTCEGNARVR